ncbi:MAG: hypothetical protein AABX48_02630 [Nanoarchaeota archaeon]
MARGDVETRNKRKRKFKENKKHPYKLGGGKRVMSFSSDADKK